MEFKNTGFVKKLYRLDELDITNMAGFRLPDDMEHEKILKQYQKVTKKEVVGAALWIIMSIVFIVTHVIMYAKTRVGVSLLFVVIFGAAAGSGIFRLKKQDIDAMAKIRDRQYQIGMGTIARTIPGLLSQSGKIVAKIRDQDGNIYSHEFEISRKYWRIWKKKTGTLFVITKLDGSGRHAYGLIYLGEGHEPETR